MLNLSLKIGHLGKDPEVRRLDNGAKVAKFSVATNESFKDKSGEWQTNTEWHTIIVWNKLAEKAEATLKKGDLVYVQGKETSRTWQDQEGATRYIQECVASYFRKLTGERTEQAQDNGYFPTEENAPAAVATTTTSPTNGNSGSSDDDLPF